MRFLLVTNQGEYEGMCKKKLSCGIFQLFFVCFLSLRNYALCPRHFTGSCLVCTIEIERIRTNNVELYTKYEGICQIITFVPCVKKFGTNREPFWLLNPLLVSVNAKYLFLSLDLFGEPHCLHCQKNKKNNKNQHFSSKIFDSNLCIVLLLTKDVIIGPATGMRFDTALTVVWDATIWPQCPTLPYMEQIEGENSLYGCCFLAQTLYFYNRIRKTF